MNAKQRPVIRIKKSDTVEYFAHNGLKEYHLCFSKAHLFCRHHCIDYIFINFVGIDCPHLISLSVTGVMLPQVVTTVLDGQTDPNVHALLSQGCQLGMCRNLLPMLNEGKNHMRCNRVGTDFR